MAFSVTLSTTGIITNYKEPRALLEAKGIAKLAKYLYDEHPDIEFTVAKSFIKELQGAFGLLLKSVRSDCCSKRFAIGRGCQDCEEDEGGLCRRRVL